MRRMLAVIIIGLLSFSTLSMFAPKAKAIDPATLGDLNSDGKVDILDMILAANAFGSTEGEPRWNPLADRDADKRITILDLILLGRNFGLIIP